MKLLATEEEEEEEENCAIRQGEHGGSLCSLEATRSSPGAVEGGNELTQFGVLLRLFLPGAEFLHGPWHQMEALLAL